MESAIVHLKAELHKRKSEAKQQNKNALPTRFTPIKPAGNLKKKENQKIGLVPEDEESKKLEKSREALEKKAALYDNIKRGSHALNEGENEKYLVDFQGKLGDMVTVDSGQDGKWRGSHTVGMDSVKEVVSEKIEFVDQFGRTRICQKGEMEYYEGMGKPDLTALHERWNKIDEETKAKNTVHYQDVLFDEARSHGASFMPFSRDEKERADQQQLLRDLGAEAEKARVTKKGLEKKRRKLMEQRLAKVRQKKRLKMGLPIKDDEFKTPPTSDEEEVEVRPPSEVNPPPNPPTLPSSEPPPENPATRTVREWDIGKPGVKMSQEEWIESRRKTRENEFAPPSSYQQPDCNSSSQSNGWKSKGKTPRYPGKRPVESAKGESKAGGYNPGCPERERVAEFAPPSTYDYYNSTSTKRSYSLGTKVDLEAAISKGLSNLREQFCNKREKD